VLMALHRGGKAGLRAVFAQWAQELRGAMFLTGSPTLEALRHVPLVRVHTP
jgi:isopentenyl diphosphate isomerase/L-lactate dehydrogenase-like FMN-dependent dehydrogenase